MGWLTYILQRKFHKRLKKKNNNALYFP
uniref:Uncharacterized protein n=1 Tax=Anguilla anguilla TaxID=7936 RepID=A0A0E9PDT6_ANGAN